MVLKPFKAVAFGNFGFNVFVYSNTFVKYQRLPGDLQGKRIKINHFSYGPLSKFAGGSDGAL
jgi:hypothetical protein